MKHGPRPTVRDKKVLCIGPRPTAGHVLGKEKAGILAGFGERIEAVIRPDLTGKGGRYADLLALADGYLSARFADY
jgi:hypothetical protein